MTDVINRPAVYGTVGCYTELKTRTERSEVSPTVVKTVDFIKSLTQSDAITNYDQNARENMP